jgi:hypothetical protein
MRKVLTSANSQPSPNRPHSSATPARCSNCHTTGASIGTQNRNISASTAQAATTYVLRSTAGGTTRIHQRLKPRRAITLC